MYMSVGTVQIQWQGFNLNSIYHFKNNQQLLSTYPCQNLAYYAFSKCFRFCLDKFLYKYLKEKSKKLKWIELSRKLKSTRAFNL